MPRRPQVLLALAIVVLGPGAVAEAARPSALALRRVDLELPGPPSAILPADLDGDGRVDLLAVVAYTRWGSIAQDRVENAVSVTDVVPALFDTREVRPFLARPDGTSLALPPLALPPEVITLVSGTPVHPVIALT